MRYLIKLSYCGSDFHGWQIQPSEASVQDTLEKALATLLQSETAVTGAGRTDAGVNAFCYVAHFNALREFDVNLLRYKLNAILPRSIVIHEIAESGENFHARFDATERKYTYFLHRVKDPFIERFSYLCVYPELDFDKMNRAAGLLVGKHDFRCFEKSGTDTKTSICEVQEAVWRPYTPSYISVMQDNPPAEPTGDYWYFTIRADRFLRNMIRAVTGTLLEVGRGKRSEADFASLILPCDPAREKSVMRSAAGESVPGEALFLSGIKF